MGKLYSDTFECTSLHEVLPRLASLESMPQTDQDDDDVAYDQTIMPLSNRRRRSVSYSSSNMSRRYRSTSSLSTKSRDSSPQRSYAGEHVRIRTPRKPKLDHKRKDRKRRNATHDTADDPNIPTSFTQSVRKCARFLLVVLAIALITTCLTIAGYVFVAVRLTSLSAISVVSSEGRQDKERRASEPVDAAAGLLYVAITSWFDAAFGKSKPVADTVWQPALDQDAQP